MYYQPKFRNINLHNVPMTHYVISQNLRERMYVVQISLLIATFLSLISQILSLMQTIKEVNPHSRIAPCVNMWSVTFLFLFFFFFFILCHLLNVGDAYAISPRKAKRSEPHHTIKMLHFVLFHSVTCYTNSIVSCIHVNTTKLRNIMCALVATGVTLRSLEYIWAAN